MKCPFSRLSDGSMPECSPDDCALYMTDYTGEEGCAVRLFAEVYVKNFALMATQNSRGKSPFERSYEMTNRN